MPFVPEPPFLPVCHTAFLDIWYDKRVSWFSTGWCCNSQDKTVTSLDHDSPRTVQGSIKWAPVDASMVCAQSKDNQPMNLKMCTMPLLLFFFSFPFWLHLHRQKFPGQGSNPHQNNDSSHHAGILNPLRHQRISITTFSSFFPFIFWLPLGIWSSQAVGWNLSLGAAEMSQIPLCHSGNSPLFLLDNKTMFVLKWL